MPPEQVVATLGIHQVRFHNKTLGLKKIKGSQFFSHVAGLLFPCSRATFPCFSHVAGLLFPESFATKPRHPR